VCGLALTAEDIERGSTVTHANPCTFRAAVRAIAEACRTCPAGLPGSTHEAVHGAVLAMADLKDALANPPAAGPNKWLAREYDARIP
jgi:hypothetical protein